MENAKRANISPKRKRVNPRFPEKVHLLALRACICALHTRASGLCLRNWYVASKLAQRAGIGICFCGELLIEIELSEFQRHRFTARAGGEALQRVSRN